MAPIRSIDARPGDIVEYNDKSGRKSRKVIKERKDSETTMPGWWLTDGSGFWDRAIDEGDWTIVREDI